jgi:hypothetical protein
VSDGHRGAPAAAITSPDRWCVGAGVRGIELSWTPVRWQLAPTERDWTAVQKRRTNDDTPVKKRRMNAGGVCATNSILIKGGG